MEDPHSIPSWGLIYSCNYDNAFAQQHYLWHSTHIHADLQESTDAAHTD